MVRVSFKGFAKLRTYKHGFGYGQSVFRFTSQSQAQTPLNGITGGALLHFGTKCHKSFSPHMARVVYPPSPHIVQNSRELSVKGASAPPFCGGLPLTGGHGCSIFRRRDGGISSRAAPFPKNKRDPAKSKDFVGKGGAAKGASFAACGEARDLELVTTQGGGIGLNTRRFEYELYQQSL